MLLSLQQQVDEVVVSSAVCLQEHWQTRTQVEFKKRKDPVTDFDISVENEIKERLGALLPEAGFIVEEGETFEREVYNWVIDPIDQTKNFVGRIPLFYTQVALIEHGIPVIGVIYNPVSHQHFSSSRGNGVSMNGKKTLASPNQKLIESIVDVDLGDDSTLTWKIQSLEKLIKSTFRIRVSGAAYAPYLLTGGIGAFIVLNEKTKLVDQLPRMAIFREAGLFFDEHMVDGHKILIAGSPSIVREVQTLLNAY